MSRYEEVLVERRAVLASIILHSAYIRREEDYLRRLDDELERLEAEHATNYIARKERCYDH